ncbi:sigma factor binding protein 1, chloroplastic-like [Salvia divinorum]|uniref:Sigma factor binding protein 1, chloroplastic-like n=1 Tax=Salvia divinorum TaxID=28513 RepID=A0ABD1FTG5_SALDI
MDHKRSMLMKKKRHQSLKVVYISSPMKVRTSAARFRALVQQLTGKNSDIAPYMDSDGGALADYLDHDGTLLPDQPPSSLSNSDTSDSLQGAVDNVFGSGIFSPEMDDVLGSYHELII